MDYLTEKALLLTLNSFQLECWLKFLPKSYLAQIPMGHDNISINNTSHNWELDNFHWMGYTQNSERRANSEIKCLFVV